LCPSGSVFITLVVVVFVAVVWVTSAEGGKEGERGVVANV
jgi:hypothetical protein